MKSNQEYSKNIRIIKKGKTKTLEIRMTLNVFESKKRKNIYTIGQKN